MWLDWRKREVLSMRVRQADFFAAVIRLDVGNTKNCEGREIPMKASVRALLVECARDMKPTTSFLHGLTENALVIFARRGATYALPLASAWFADSAINLSAVGSAKAVTAAI
jgi:hypothetical protein